MTFEMKRGTLCPKITGKVDSFKRNWMKFHEKVARKSLHEAMYFEEINNNNLNI